MSVPTEIFLYFLTDVLGRSYYVDNNGYVKLSTESIWLEQSPDGWMNSKIGISRNPKLFGINRTFTNPTKYYNDGAKILRHLYVKKGVEAQVFLVILKHDDETDIYQPYYKGELDMSTLTGDVAEGVTVNIMEGGITKLLKSNETTTIEVPCDGTIPENILINANGILFPDKFTYSAFEMQLEGILGVEVSWAIPLVYVNNEGDNVGIQHGDQSPERTDNLDDYLRNSGNYYFSSVGPLALTMTGEINFACSGGGTAPNHFIFSLYVVKSDGSYTEHRLSDLHNTPQGAQFSVDISGTINIDANDKIFFISTFIGGAPFNNPADFTVQSSEFYLQFNSRYPASQVWGISARDLFKYLVNEIGDSAYGNNSELLDSIPEICFTSGDALRASTDPLYPTKPVIKTSIGSFFTSLDAILMGAMSNQTLPGQTESLFFEDRRYVFNSDVITLSLGEVSEFSHEVARDYFFNEAQFGAKDQKYDLKQGKYETNTTAQFKNSMTRIPKKYLGITEYRIDPTGVEYTRYNNGNKSTTNNASDNDVFTLVRDMNNPIAREYTAAKEIEQNYNTNLINLNFDTYTGVDFSVDSSNSVFTFKNSLAQNVFFSVGIRVSASGSPAITLQLFQNGVLLASQSGNANDQNFSLTGTAIFSQADQLQVKISGPNTTYTVKAASLLFSLTASKIYNLLRVNYDEVNGIPNPESIFNIEYLTPKRMAMRHSGWLKSIMYATPDDVLQFITLDKNKDLVTIKDGIAITESADIFVSDMDKPLFIPIIFTFKTKVPLTFIQVFDGAANGHIEFSYNGKLFYGFPLDVSVIPALQDAQEWKLLCSPKTDINNILDLDTTGLKFYDMAGYQTFIPHLSPVKFVPENLTQPAQYNFQHIDEALFSVQVKNWPFKADYLQKWQMNDIIKLQCRTNGLGPVQLMVYDSNNVLKDTIDFVQKLDPAVVSPMVLYECNIPLTDFEDGAYYFKMVAGTGEVVTKFISEPIWVKQQWTDTLLFEYKHTSNKQGTVFSTGYNPSFRVEGWIDSYKPMSKYAVYENQPADLEMINGIPYSTYKLNIGREKGVPPYVIRLVDRIMLLNTVTLDGKGYTRNTDANMQAVDVPGWPMKYWTLDIRERENRDGITLSTDGDLDNNITIVYNINTKAFGDGSTDNIVHVTKVD